MILCYAAKILETVMLRAVAASLSEFEKEEQLHYRL
jgi:hypothetical protein